MISQKLTMIPGFERTGFGRDQITDVLDPIYLISLESHIHHTLPWVSCDFFVSHMGMGQNPGT